MKKTILNWRHWPATKSDGEMWTYSDYSIELMSNGKYSSTDKYTSRYTVSFSYIGHNNHIKTDSENFRMKADAMKFITRIKKNPDSVANSLLSMGRFW